MERSSNAVFAPASGAAVALSGLAVPQLRGLYNYGWFVRFGVSFLAYLILVRGRQSSLKIEASSSTARSL